MYYIYVNNIDFILGLSSVFTKCCKNPLESGV